MIQNLMFLYFNGIGTLEQILLTMGINQNNSLKHIDANVDFTEIENGCDITSTYWIRYQQLKGDGGVDRGCLDIYSYNLM